MTYIYICILELRLIPAAHCRSIPCCIQFCMFVYFYTIYMKRILSEQHDWDTFTTLIILQYINLPGDIHHPDAGFHLNLPRCSDLHNCFSGIILFSLDILTRSNTLKLFPFLLFLPEVFLYSH